MNIKKMHEILLLSIFVLSSSVIFSLNASDDRANHITSAAINQITSHITTDIYKAATEELHTFCSSEHRQKKKLTKQIESYQKQEALTQIVNQSLEKLRALQAQLSAIDTYLQEDSRLGNAEQTPSNKNKYYENETSETEALERARLILNASLKKFISPQDKITYCNKQKAIIEKSITATSETIRTTFEESFK